MPAPPRQDFQELKRRVSIEQVLDARGLLHAFSISARKLVGPCPLHHGDSSTAFVVSRDKNLWYCFTRCHVGGDVIDLVRRLDRSGYLQAGRTLARLAGPILPDPLPRSPFRPYTAALPLDSTTPFLGNKGITPQTAQDFEAGLFPGRGFLHGCVAVRLHDPHGQPLGYAGRILDPDRVRREGKWRLPTGFPKRSVLYNYHRVREHLSEAVVVVEDPWSVMRLAQLAVPAVALLGTVLSRDQRTLLQPGQRLLLMLDGDAAGRAAARTLVDSTSHQDTKVVVAHLPANTDPDQLSDLELHTLWQDFRALRQRP